MSMLKNWDVGGGLSDFWAYIREPRPHRWTVWGLAIVLPLLIFYGFSNLCVIEQVGRNLILRICSSSLRFLWDF